MKEIGNLDRAAGVTPVAADPLSDSSSTSDACADGTSVVSDARPLLSSDGYDRQTNATAVSAPTRRRSSAETTASHGVVRTPALVAARCGQVSPLSFNPSVQGRAFDQQSEFPNLLLWAADKANPDPARARQRIEQALAAIFRRVVVPVPQADGSIRFTDYFADLQAQVAKSGAEVVVTGGVLRATIGYVYDRLYQGMARNPPVHPADTLDALIAETGNLSGLELRGPGSDWDLTLRTPGGTPPEDLNAARAFTSTLLHQRSEPAPDSSHDQDLMFQSILFKADINDYDTQVTRALASGGNSCDLLGFNVSSGELVDPPEHPGLARDLVAGTLRFLKPGSSAPEDPADTTIRAVRAMLELPWLIYPEQDQAYLRSRIEALGDKSVSQLSARALGQFEKATRSSRYCGAHNRLYRAEAGSLERAFLDLSEHFGLRIRQFIDARPLERRSGAEASRIPSDALVPMDVFFRDYTDNGFLYHGTRSLEAGLAIIRGGLFVSNDQQGLALHGAGAYAAPDPSVAQTFAGDAGLVFKLAVRKDQPLRIVKMESRFYGRVGEEARRAGMDPNEWLAREYGVDIIISKFPLVWNTAALEFPKDPVALIETYAGVLESPHATLAARASALSFYRTLFGYARALGAHLSEPGVHAAKLAKDSLALCLDPAAPLEERGRMLVQYAQLYAAFPEAMDRSLTPPSTAAALLTQTYGEVLAKQEDEAGISLALTATEVFDKLPVELRQQWTISPDAAFAAVRRIFAAPTTSPAGRLQAMRALAGLLGNSPSCNIERLDVSLATMQTLSLALVDIANGAPGPLLEIAAILEDGNYGCYGDDPEISQRLSAAAKRVLGEMQFDNSYRFCQYFSLYVRDSSDPSEVAELFCRGISTLLAQPNAVVLPDHLRRLAREYPRVLPQAREEIGAKLSTAERRLRAFIAGELGSNDSHLILALSTLDTVAALTAKAGSHLESAFSQYFIALGQWTLDQPADASRHLLYAEVLPQVIAARSLTASELEQAGWIAEHARAMVGRAQDPDGAAQWKRAAEKVQAVLASPA